LLNRAATVDTFGLRVFAIAISGTLVTDLDGTVFVFFTTRHAEFGTSVTDLALTTTVAIVLTLCGVFAVTGGRDTLVGVLQTVKLLTFVTGSTEAVATATTAELQATLGVEKIRETEIFGVTTFVVFDTGRTEFLARTALFDALVTPHQLTTTPGDTVEVFVTFVGTLRDGTDAATGIADPACRTAAFVVTLDRSFTLPGLRVTGETIGALVIKTTDQIHTLAALTVTQRTTISAGFARGGHSSTDAFFAEFVFFAIGVGFAFANRDFVRSSVGAAITGGILSVTTGRTVDECRYKRHHQEKFQSFDKNLHAEPQDAMQKMGAISALFAEIRKKQRSFCTIPSKHTHYCIRVFWKQGSKTVLHHPVSFLF
jgi:hypothetical protein